VGFDGVGRWYYEAMRYGGGAVDIDVFSEAEVITEELMVRCLGWTLMRDVRLLSIALSSAIFSKMPSTSQNC